MGEGTEMTGAMVEEGTDMMIEEMTDMEEIDMVVTGMAEIAMVVIVTEVTAMEIEEEGTDMEGVETGTERTDMGEDQEGLGHPVPTTGSRDQGGTTGPDPGAMNDQDTEQ